jgi:hypothetical protein
MIANIDEQHAIRILFDDNRKRNLYTDWSDIKEALDELAIPHDGRARRVARLETIACVAIVACDRCPTGKWHWVVYDPTVTLVYDPLEEEPTPHLQFRKRPFSYLGVQPKR